MFNLTDRTALFGSWITGLEESGAAPGSATNRDEVLPPASATPENAGPTPLTRSRHRPSPRSTWVRATASCYRPAGLRIVASNLTGEEGYTVARSGWLSPVSPRTIRAVLAVSFGAGD